jgi:transposase
MTLMRRWVIQRMSGWLGQIRSLIGDDERHSETSEAWVYTPKL